MTEENNGKTLREYNPRFLQYARWRGMTPEEVMAADAEEFPGGRMAGFILWNDERIWEWCQETGTNRCWSVCFTTQVSEWIDKKMAEREQKEQDYLKGNTRELAAEWEFSFVASHADDNRKIPTSRMEAFWDKVLDAAEEHELVIGGGWKAITDADYEAMDDGQEDS